MWRNIPLKCFIVDMGKGHSPVNWTSDGFGNWLSLRLWYEMPYRTALAKAWGWCFLQVNFKHASWSQHKDPLGVGQPFLWNLSASPLKKMPKAHLIKWQQIAVYFCACIVKQHLGFDFCPQKKNYRGNTWAVFDIHTSEDENNTDYLRSGSESSILVEKQSKVSEFLDNF